MRECMQLYTSEVEIIRGVRQKNQVADLLILLIDIRR